MVSSVRWAIANPRSANTDASKPDALDDGPSDGSADGAANTVECTWGYRRATGTDSGGLTTCTLDWHTEPDVHFWFEPDIVTGDPEAALGTDSAGIFALYTDGGPGVGLFRAQDVEHTLYRGANDATQDFGTAHRSGDLVTFTLDAKRFGSPPIGCESVPLVTVACSGTTRIAPRP